MKGSKDIVKLLLSNGADSSLANNNSMTPLHAVSKSGNKEIISLLLNEVPILMQLIKKEELL